MVAGMGHEKDLLITMVDHVRDDNRLDHRNSGMGHEARLTTMVVGHEEDRHATMVVVVRETVGAI